MKWTITEEAKYININEQRKINMTQTKNTNATNKRIM